MYKSKLQRYYWNTKMSCLRIFFFCVHNAKEIVRAAVRANSADEGSTKITIKNK